jgi:hypothetical protein
VRAWRGGLAEDLGARARPMMRGKKKGKGKRALTGRVGASEERSVTVRVFVMLGIHFVSMKYMFVCIKLMCVYVKFLKI